MPRRQVVPVAEPPAPIGERVQPFPVLAELGVLAAAREVRAGQREESVITGQAYSVQAAHDADGLELVPTASRFAMHRVAFDVFAATAMLGVPSRDNFRALKLKQPQLAVEVGSRMEDHERLQRGKQALLAAQRAAFGHRPAAQRLEVIALEGYQCVECAGLRVGSQLGALGEGAVSSDDSGSGGRGTRSRSAASSSLSSFVPFQAESCSRMR